MLCCCHDANVMMLCCCHDGVQLSWCCAVVMMMVLLSWCCAVVMMLYFCHDAVLLSWCCAVVMMLCLLLCCKSASVFVLTQFIEGIAEKKPLKFFRHKSAPPPSYLYICQHLKLKDLTTRVRFLFKLRKWAEFFQKNFAHNFFTKCICLLFSVSCIMSPV